MAHKPFARQVLIRQAAELYDAGRITLARKLLERLARESEIQPELPPIPAKAVLKLNLFKTSTGAYL